MTLPLCLRCPTPLTDPVSLAERMCPDCALELDLLPEAMRVAEMARLRAAWEGR
jgi:NMD protein affecting ribosome stability and mRNA decay